MGDPGDFIRLTINGSVGAKNYRDTETGETRKTEITRSGRVETWVEDK